MLAFAGASCGFLNTLASSGSAVSLPILVMLGMPEGAANATNRLPVIVGSAVAALTFWRKGMIDWTAALKLTVPAMAGAIIGTLCAERMPNKEMGYLITAAVLLALILLFTKTKHALSRETAGPATVTPLAIALMFFVGIWLVLILICSFALPQANALKSLILMMTTLVAIVMFWSSDEVKVAEGIVLSAGAVFGGYFGAKLSHHVKSRKWAFNLLVLVMSLELLHLGWYYTAFMRA